MIIGILVRIINNLLLVNCLALLLCELTEELDGKCHVQTHVLFVRILAPILPRNVPFVVSKLIVQESPCRIRLPAPFRSEYLFAEASLEELHAYCELHLLVIDHEWFLWSELMMAFNLSSCPQPLLDIRPFMDRS